MIRTKKQDFNRPVHHFFVILQGLVDASIPLNCFFVVCPIDGFRTHAAHCVLAGAPERAGIPRVER
jgi:hypothetical protein